MKNSSETNSKSFEQQPNEKQLNDSGSVSANVN